MRLSGHIKNKKTASAPLPARNATHSVAGGPATAARNAPLAPPAPPAYSADLPTPAIAGFPLRQGFGGQVAKAGVALATKAGSKITPFSSPPRANKNLFRLSDLIMKKQAAFAPVPEPVPAPAPVAEPAPESAPVPVPVPVTEHALEPLPAGMDSPGPDEKVSDAAPARPPTAPGAQQLPARNATHPPTSLDEVLRAGSVVSGRAGNAIRRGEIAGGPAKASAASEETANASHFEKHPAHIYEICRQFGIAVPKDGVAIIKQAQVCLVTVFKKIMLPASEQYIIWLMIKSIASDLEGIIAADATVLNILNRYRAKEEKLIWHSIYTAILAMDLAKNEENLSCSVCEIGGAALLHDAGFLIQTTNGFDANGFDNISDPKSPEFREHVGKSVEIARRIEAPDAVVTMIAQHQGRADGQGLPKDLSPSKFERGSQILAIASTFEHAICDLSMEKKEAAPENAGEPGNNGITKVFQEYRKAFDMDLLKKMIALVGFYPVGSMVELNNRAICKVVKQNNSFPLRPMVQVIMDGTGMHPEQGKLIDLKDVKILSILRTIASPERETKQE